MKTLKKLLNFENILKFFKKNQKTDVETSKNDKNSDNESYGASDISEAINQAFDDKQDKSFLSN